MPEIAREREREREREKKNQVPPFPRQGDWSFGEGYAHDIMGDLNAGGGRHRISSYFVARSAYMVNHISLVQGAGWIDWNLLLNEDGGPNHVGNVCGQLFVRISVWKSFSLLAFCRINAGSRLQFNRLTGMRNVQLTKLRKVRKFLW